MPPAAGGGDCRGHHSRAYAGDGSSTGLPLQAESGWTDIFIYPGFQFVVLDGLLTNFHLPKSTPIMLVSACRAGNGTGGLSGGDSPALPFL